jgi:outer membrane lipoprotein SlyB
LDVRKTIFAVAAMLPLVACTQTEQGATIGALGGAAIGSAVASPGNRAEGALVGGVAGAVAGALIGRANEPGRCIYQRRDGSRYVASC